MIKRLGFIWALGLWVCGCGPEAANVQAQVAVHEIAEISHDTLRPPYLILDSNEIKFQKEIAVFRQLDSASFPQDIEVVFNGSSSIRKWEKLDDDMPGLKVLNRGFGGSTIRQCTYYAPQIVLPYHPEVIVLYAGENDFAYTPEASDSLPLQSFQQYVELIHFFLPETHIFFVSMKPSPSRQKLQSKFDRGNILVEAYTQTDSRLHYIDVASKMKMPNGDPLPDIWLRDKLHMNEKGYAIWRREIHGRLTDFFNAEKGR